MSFEKHSLKGSEVDSLQVEFAKLRKKWYQEPSTWISIFAVIVSVFVFFVTVLDLRFEQQKQLNTVIQQLSEIREKIVENQAEYGDKAPTPSVALRQPLIEEAIKLDDLVGANSFQRMIIAEALNETNQPDRAERIAEKAEKAEPEASNRLEKILAAQVHAVAYFNQGKPKEGRLAYSRALKAVEIEVPADSVDIFTKALYKLDTEQLWISSELRIDNCPGAKERLLKLESYGKDFPKSQAGEFKKRMELARENLAKNCP